jgi:hypothetical protein
VHSASANVDGRSAVVLHPTVFNRSHDEQMIAGGMHRPDAAGQDGVGRPQRWRMVGGSLHVDPVKG